MGRCIPVLLGTPCVCLGFGRDGFMKKSKALLRPTQNNTQKAHFRRVIETQHLHAGVWGKLSRFSRFSVRSTHTHTQKHLTNPILSVPDTPEKAKLHQFHLKIPLRRRSQQDRQIAFFASLPKNRRKSDKFPIFKRNSGGSLRIRGGYRRVENGGVTRVEFGGLVVL